MSTVQTPALSVVVWANIFEVNRYLGDIVNIVRCIPDIAEAAHAERPDRVAVISREFGAALTSCGRDLRPCRATDPRGVLVTSHRPPEVPMHANVGDWLLVRGHNHDQPDRRGQILAVNAQGEPPYTVRWSNDDHEGIVFPGPDAQVLTVEQLAHLDRVRFDRSTRPSS